MMQSAHQKTLEARLRLSPIPIDDWWSAANDHHGSGDLVLHWIPSRSLEDGQDYGECGTYLRRWAMAKVVLDASANGRGRGHQTDLPDICEKCLAAFEDLPWL